MEAFVFLANVLRHLVFILIEAAEQQVLKIQLLPVCFLHLRTMEETLSGLKTVFCVTRGSGLRGCRKMVQQTWLGYKQETERQR